ncbi:MAG: hydrogenase maturation protease, partial [Verrucomicrobiae bacterium]|nr:hydrogenase maturation protease [Verrucomicrobiae bacterium]
MKRLIIGYGNESRNDDGVGWFVVRELSKQDLHGVKLETAHQLEVDMVERLADCDEVIFVDAAVPESHRRWWSEEIEPAYRPRAVAHVVTPFDLLGLCRALYG